MKCPNCGADVPAGDLFCGECGSRVTPEEKPVPSAPPPSIAPPPAESLKKGPPKRLLIGCGAGLAVAVIAACILGVVVLLKPTESTPTATLAVRLSTKAPSATPLPTDTPAPIATSTDTPAPAATSTSTPAPTATPPPTPASPTPGPAAPATPLLDLSDVVLTVKDLDPVFQEMSPEELGLNPEDMSQGGFTIESLFLFMASEPLEFVMGFTTLLPTQLERTGFDVVVNQPDLLLSSFISGMGATEVLEQDELPGLDDIGDASAGLTVVADMQGIPMRIDAAVFRRDVAGAFVFVMYLDGGTPLVPVGDAARKLDSLVLSKLASLLFEDFGDPASGWAVEADDTGEWGYRDGAFFIRVSASDWMKWDTAGYNFHDFTLAVDAQQTAGPTDNEYGVLFRYVDGDNFYSFDVNGEGSFSLFKKENGEWTTMVDWRESVYINPIGEFNHLKVTCQGDQITLYANDHELISVTDDSFAQGDVGLFAGTFDEPEVEAIFDNLLVTENP